MVVLSAAMCSRQGKSLMARQFVEMQRSALDLLDSHQIKRAPHMD
jgi:hypothetical protein